MNIDVRDRAVVQTTAATRLAIADRGIHRSPRDGMKGLYPCMEPHWRDHLRFGKKLRYARIAPDHPSSMNS